MAKKKIKKNAKTKEIKIEKAVENKPYTKKKVHEGKTKDPIKTKNNLCAGLTIFFTLGSIALIVVLALQLYPQIIKTIEVIKEGSAEGEGIGVFIARALREGGVSFVNIFVYSSCAFFAALISTIDAKMSREVTNKFLKVFRIISKILNVFLFIISILVIVTGVLMYFIPSIINLFPFFKS